MNVRCEACGVVLKVNEERLGGRTSAKCPKCGAGVALAMASGAHSRGATATTPSSAMLHVSCPSCGARLRAPASRAGTTSRCPKCGAAVQVRQTTEAAAVGPVEHEESSSVATRRIDSRALGVGLMAMAANKPVGADVALDDLLKAKPAVPRADTSELEAGELPAAALLRPPVGALVEAAHGIRQAAEELGQSPRERTVSAPPAQPSGQRSTAPGPIAPAVPLPAKHERPAGPPQTPHVAVRPLASDSGASAARPIDRYPASRGLVAGSLAGLVVGGLCTALATGALPGVAVAGIAWLISPLPFSFTSMGLSDTALRVIIPAALGALAGFIAAGAGTPTRSDRPISLLRCASAGLLAGLAAGLISSLTEGLSTRPFSVWPTLNWMRDLLLVGMLTPAVNKLMPSPPD